MLRGWRRRGHALGDNRVNRENRKARKQDEIAKWGVNRSKMNELITLLSQPIAASNGLFALRSSGVSFS